MYICIYYQYLKKSIQDFYPCKHCVLHGKNHWPLVFSTDLNLFSPNCCALSRHASSHRRQQKHKKKKKRTGTSQGNNNEPIQFVTDSQKRKRVEEPSRVNVIEVSLKVDRVERVVKRIVSTHLLEPNR